MASPSVIVTCNLIFLVRGRQTHKEERQLFSAREGGVLDIVHLLPSFHFLSVFTSWKPTVTAALAIAYKFSYFPPWHKTSDIIYKKKLKIGGCCVEIRWGISKWMQQWPSACYLHCDNLLSLAKQLCVGPNLPRPL